MFGRLNKEVGGQAGVGLVLHLRWPPQRRFSGMRVRKTRTPEYIAPNPPFFSCLPVQRRFSRSRLLSDLWRGFVHLKRNRCEMLIAVCCRENCEDGD